MIVSRVSVLLLCILSMVLGFSVFLRGFLTLKTSIQGSATYTQQPLEPQLQCSEEYCDVTNSTTNLPVTYQRMVFILIDALRADFVFPSTQTDLPHLEFVSSLIQSRNAYGYVAKAHPPTVTLPRIKALMSGGIPGFVDVVFNFDSQALEEDNLVSQLQQHGKKIVFYGDDTWIRLFPGHFLRSEGTTSFFVTDYTEVDTNVTRHVTPELEAKDWDVLILHYLGLDHIGHLAGPRSPLVPDKLTEMDEIIRSVYEAVVQQDDAMKTSTLLVVCGDHGMSDQGSHGGSSASETATPLVLMSSKIHHVGHRSVEDGTPEPMEVQQIDVAPTLAMLLGTPIPRNSLGVAIVESLHSLSPRDRMRALHRNSRQIQAVFKENIGNYEADPSFLLLERATAAHQQWMKKYGTSEQAQHGIQLADKICDQYTSAMKQMRDKVADSMTVYDLHAMTLGIALLWLVLLGMTFAWRRSHVDINLTFRLICIAALFIYTWCHVVCCTSNYRSNVLCKGSPVSMIMSCAVILTMSIWTAIILVNIQNGHSNMKESSKSYIAAEIPLMAGCVLHTLSLMSSSFVEEEHQTWYFFTVTVNVLLTGRILIELLIVHMNGIHFSNPIVAHTHGKYAASRNTEMANIMEDTRTPYMRHSKSNRNSIDGPFVQCADGDDNRNAERERLGRYQLLENVAAGSLSLLLCRVMRSWNSTGDKWSHLLDVGDWLCRPENKFVLSIVISASVVLAWVVHCLGNAHHLVASSLMSIGVVMVYCFRASNGVVYFPYLYEDSVVAKGLFEARVVYSIIIIHTIHAIINYVIHTRSGYVDGRRKAATENRFTSTGRSSIASHADSRHLQCSLTDLLENLQKSWALLALLLSRPHNIPLVVMMFVQEKVFSYMLSHIKLSVTSTTWLYLWMGQASYFYQGNSNSLSTVDISAGYIGLDGYQPVLIGILMALATYAGPVYWLLSLIIAIARRSQDKRTRFQSSVWEACHALCWSHCLPLACYTVLVTMQRYHLFVWTVFSPKLLYLGMYTLVMAVINLSMVIVSYAV